MMDKSKYPANYDKDVLKVKEVLAHVKVNVNNLMALDAALSTGNAEIARLNSAYPPQKRWYGAHCYTAIHYGLVVSLALTLARLFDEGSQKYPPDKRDVASLPLLVHLLGKDKVRLQLIEEARGWPIDGSKTVATKIENAIVQWRDLDETENGRSALNLLKEFRNKRLAHTLNKPMDTAGPRYADLTILRDTALRITADARLAIDGDSWEPFDFLEERIRQGRAFWSPAIQAIITSEESRD
jgi:hypothetical protein